MLLLVEVHGELVEVIGRAVHVLVAAGLIGVRLMLRELLRIVFVRHSEAVEAGLLLSELIVELALHLWLLRLLLRRLWMRLVMAVVVLGRVVSAVRSVRLVLTAGRDLSARRSLALTVWRRTVLAIAMQIAEPIVVAAVLRVHRSSAAERVAVTVRSAVASIASAVTQLDALAGR